MATELDGEPQTLTINDEVYELEVDLNPLVVKKDVQIPLKRKESNWANINPSSPKKLGSEAEKPKTSEAKEPATNGTSSTSTAVEKKADKPEVAEKKEVAKPKEDELGKRERKPKTKPDEPERRLSSREKKPTAEGVDKAEENAEDGESDGSSSEEAEETYELEKIIKHRVVKKKKKPVNEYLVRWLGYGPEADTWEPEANILGEAAIEQIAIYWEEQKAKQGGTKKDEVPEAGEGEKKENGEETEKATSEPPAKKQKTEEAAAYKRGRGRPSAPVGGPWRTFSKDEIPQCATKSIAPGARAIPILETDSAEAVANKSSDFSSSAGSIIDLSDNDGNSWYGIKKEDVMKKGVKREMKNLFVNDRVQTLSEKLLAEVGTNSTGRVTRSSLKPLKEDIDPPKSDSRNSKTPEPLNTKRRRRQTASPAAATSANRYSPEPPVPKKSRKSMPALKEPEKVKDEPVEEPTSKKSDPTVALPASPAVEVVPETVVSESVAAGSSAPPIVVPEATEAAPSDTAVETATTQPTPEAVVAPVKILPKPKKSAPTPISLVPQNSLIPDRVRPTLTTKTATHSDNSGSLPPQIRIRQLQPQSVSSKDSSAEPRSPHILDPLAIRAASQRESLLGGPSTSSASAGFQEPKTEAEECEVLTQDDFQNLRNRAYPECNVDDYYNDVTTAQFDPQKVAQTYDEFVASVLTGDAETVYTTANFTDLNLKLNETDSKGKTLLHHVVERKCDNNHAYDAIIEILVQNKANISAVDKEHARTALHTAICLRHLCLVKQLVLLGAPVNTVDSKRFTPLISAMLTKDLEMVKVLLNAGANVEKAITFCERTKSISEDICNLVIGHRKKIIECLDEARHYILPQATVSTFGTIPSSLFITPLAETDLIEYSFHITKNIVVRPPNNYLLFECAVIDIDTFNETHTARMWQQSPIKRILINGNEPINFHKTTNFISLPQLFDGPNNVRIELMNQVYKGTRYCIVSRLAHVFMAGFARSKRLEPTVGNLLPQIMGNPAGYKSHPPPALQKLATELRPKFYRQPTLSRQSLPSQRKAAPYPSIADFKTPQAFRSPAVTTSSYQMPSNGSSPASSTYYSVTPTGFVQVPSTTSSSPSLPLKGYVPLRRSSLVSNGGALRGRPMLTPLSAASNRIGLRPSSSATTTTSTQPSRPSQYSIPKPHLQRQG